MFAGMYLKSKQQNSYQYAKQEFILDHLPKVTNKYKKEAGNKTTSEMCENVCEMAWSGHLILKDLFISSLPYCIMSSVTDALIRFPFIAHDYINIL